jgi:oligogalacturonide lyase
MAVHEKSGEIVQVTEGGYFGMLNLARKSMNLYFLQRSGSSIRLIEDNLDALFRDSRSNRLKEASYYQRVCGTIPVGMGVGGDMALDADEEWVYFRVGAEEARQHLPEGAVIEPNFGPRHMGAGPSGIARMQVKTGEIRYVVSVPFQIGHIQCNPWLPGEIVFCWETGGKSPQRTWTVRADGSGLRPVYRESEHDWVTHEAVITPDEVAIAIMGHRPVRKEEKDSVAYDPTNPGQESGWGPCGTRAYPTGLGIVNLRTGEI